MKGCKKRFCESSSFRGLFIIWFFKDENEKENYGDNAFVFFVHGRGNNESTSSFSLFSGYSTTLYQRVG